MTTDAELYMDSPVLVGDHLYFRSNKRAGTFVCLDPATGELVWQSPGRWAAYASVIAVGDRLLVLTDEAELKVIAADPSAYQELASWEVATSSTWSHLALSGSRVYVKDEEHLAGFDLAAERVTEARDQPTTLTEPQAERNAGEDSTPDTEAVEVAVRELLKTLETGDMDLMLTYLGEDFRSDSGASKTVFREYLGSTAGTETKSEDMRVEWEGATAKITGVRWIRGTMDFGVDMLSTSATASGSSPSSSSTRGASSTSRRNGHGGSPTVVHWRCPTEARAEKWADEVADLVHALAVGYASHCSRARGPPTMSSPSSRRSLLLWTVRAGSRSAAAASRRAAVPVRPKVFDTLRALVENSDRLLHKEELMTIVWPHRSAVDESNLTHNVSVLRKILGQTSKTQYVVTVPGRGYRFTAPVEASLEGSIRVRPFASLSPDSDQDFFCQGMAQELIDALAGVEGLRVVGRTSSFDRRLRELAHPRSARSWVYRRSSRAACARRAINCGSRRD